MAGPASGARAGRFCVVLVHAHPDDECSGTGGLIARCAREGHTTVLVTCTNGEMGEVKDKRLRLRPDENPADRDRLGRVRLRELERAGRVLGLTHIHPLGYRDSGMAGWESNNDPAAFANADLEEAAGRIAAILRRHRPDVLITYNASGGYGHPDHVMAHRAAMAAVEAAADPGRLLPGGAGEGPGRAGGAGMAQEGVGKEGMAPWKVRKVYHAAWSREKLLRTWRWMRALGRKTPLDDPDFRADRFGTPDEEITTRIDVRPFLRRKWRALRAHRSQIAGNFFWWFIRLTGRWLYNEETFVCVRSEVPVRRGETCIFEGL